MSNGFTALRRRGGSEYARPPSPLRTQLSFQQDSAAGGERVTSHPHSCFLVGYLQSLCLFVVLGAFFFLSLKGNGLQRR